MDLLIVRNRRDTGRSGPTPLARDPRARSTTRKAYRPRGIEGSVPGVIHKTELGLVRVGLTDSATIRAEADRIFAARYPWRTLQR